MRRNGELVHKLFTHASRGHKTELATRVIAAAGLLSHAMATRDETVFVCSSGTFVEPLSRRRLRESMPSPRDPSRTYPRRRPSRKPRFPIPEKTSALRGRLREKAFLRRHSHQARQ